MISIFSASEKNKTVTLQSFEGIDINHDKCFLLTDITQTEGNVPKYYLLRFCEPVIAHSNLMNAAILG